MNEMNYRKENITITKKQLWLEFRYIIAASQEINHILLLVFWKQLL